MAGDLLEFLSGILLEIHAATTEAKAESVVATGHRRLDSIVPASSYPSAEVSLARSLIDDHLRLRLTRIALLRGSTLQRSTPLSQATCLPRLRPPPGLSPREAEVLGWLAAGKQDSEIAFIIGVSVRTANKHVENLMRKLAARTRGAAVGIARAMECERRSEHRPKRTDKPPTSSGV